MKRFISSIITIALTAVAVVAQVNTDQVMRIGRNVLYFEDYVLSIQYFNQVIGAKPYLAQPYFYRAIAKLNLEDYQGAVNDATLAIERNPFITDAYEVRGVAFQNLGRNSDAIADYDKALESLPDNRSLLYNKAMALREVERYDEAAETFDHLLRYNPKFDGGYIGRAQLHLSQADTVAALSDVNQALQLNKNGVNGYVLRAAIRMGSEQDYQGALEDMDMAIRLEPRYTGFFINRAYIRYKLDDLYGAMADYDYALQLEPLNAMALTNRALLRAELKDLNRAVADLTQVIKSYPADYRALFNRALLNNELGHYDEALEDLDLLLNEFPDFSAAYYLRYDIKHSMGDKSAQADLDRSLALAKTVITTESPLTKETQEETQDEVKARFTSLLAVEDSGPQEQVYNNKNIKGRVQDNNLSIELEPILRLSYYATTDELRQSSDYMREVKDINDTRILRFLLQLTNRDNLYTDADVFNAHTSSIKAFDNYLATHAPRAIDYFGRGMDYMTLRDYRSAIADFGSAVAMTPDFTLGWFARAIASYYLLKSEDVEEMAEIRALRAMVIDDFDEAIKLNPTLALAFYNKGVVLAEAGDFTSSLAAFNQAIDLKADFGEAYYNRGYVFLQLGNRDRGMADLSKAGELGILPSYSLIKRMSR